MNELVSIIMPAYNAEKFIEAAISSALSQLHQDIELIVINDGSTDNTVDLVKSFDDERIILINSQNEGVSAARNKGLAVMRGNYFTFLDADDELPKQSISLRMEVMRNNPNVHFVDGWIVRMDESLEQEIGIQKPDWAGPPLEELLKLNPAVFSGLTWLIRRDNQRRYSFTTGMTHAEDLWFFISIASQGEYQVVEHPTLLYRQVHGSAMSNIGGLEMGYSKLVQLAKEQQVIKASSQQLRFMSWKCRSIVWKSYLKRGRLKEAMRVFFLGLKKELPNKG